MHKNLVGQTPKQTRNSKEQKKRRDDIKKKFPKTITFYTYESIDQTILEQKNKIRIAFAKLEEKMRDSELKSLAITYYIHTYRKNKKREKLEFIYDFLAKDNSTLKELIAKLGKEYPRKNGKKWNRELILDYLLFKK